MTSRQIAAYAFFLSLYFFALACPASAFAASGEQTSAANDFNAHDFPEITGKIVKTSRYADVSGENLILLTETDIINPEQELRSKGLFAYRYLLQKDGTKKLIWRVDDYVIDCDLDGLTAYFIQDALQITELNDNDEAEIWMSYVLQCAGDPGPKTMKIIMYEGDQKYAVLGETRSLVAEDKYAGGEYALDAAFTSGPAEFAEFARELWEKHKDRN